MDEETRRVPAPSPGHMSRRELLRRTGVGAGALSLTALTSACGLGGGGGDEARRARAPRGPDYTTTETTGFVNVANRVRYGEEERVRHILEDFEQATGISVNYRGVIEDDASFFTTIRGPLSDGRQIGWDVIVVADWMTARMAKAGYLEELEHSLLSNFQQHAGAIYKDPSYDPRNRHSLPWQAGIVGIAYNRKKTRRRISSFEDLFDPAFAGRVGMLSDMRDTMNLALLGVGIDPEKATVDDAERAQQKLLDQRYAQIVRDYYGSEYVDSLAAGDVWVTMARSEEVFSVQLHNPDVHFVVPEEGGLLWVDSMVIPQHSTHPVDALAFMNFVYEPEVAAQIAASIRGHVAPVAGARAILAKADARRSRRIAESPLVFPPPEIAARLHSYKMLDEEEEEVWHDLFERVIYG